MTVFSFLTRTSKKKKKVYYVRFKKPEGGYYTALSTGQSTKRDALEWVDEYLKKNGYGQTIRQGKRITFGDYSNDFFSFSGMWATDKKARGLRISERHCRERADLLKNHVLPFFGPYKLSDINRAAIKEYRNSLYQKGYSGSTINKCLSTLKAVLESAEEAEIINALPRIDRTAENPRRKGILTVEEVHRLFLSGWNSIEATNHPARENLIGRTANMLAASTGMRAGEIQAITHSNIDINRGVICVCRSWDVRLRRLNATTKTGKARNIFIPQAVKSEVLRLMMMHPNPSPDAFLFFSERMPEQPVNQRVFIESLHKALSEIGIQKEERTERNITFHSWRGFMNSLMINKKIPLTKVMRITGHLTKEMADHYYTIDDMADVRELQEDLFN